MIIVFPYCHKDQDQAVRLADWLHEIGPFLDHDLITVRDYRASAIPKLGPLSPFRSSKEIVVSDDVHNSWPQSPNLMFSKAAKYIEYGPKQPWLWLEPDAIPLRASAFHEIEAEYQTALASNKFFLGDFVHLPEPGFKDHMSGVAVYPPNMTHHAGDAVMTPEIAWDCAAARQILPKMFQSELILHRWKHPAFTSWEEVEQRIFSVRPKCALFHADKQGSLFELLRQHGKEGDATCPAPHTGITSSSAAPSVQPASDAAAQVPFVPPRKEEIAEYVESKLAEVSEAAELPGVGPGHSTLERLLNANVEQTPWASKPDSLAEIQRLADRLKQFGDNASHVRAVRMILNDTGVITLPYRFKKRGKWRRKRKKKL